MSESGLTETPQAQPNLSEVPVLKTPQLCLSGVSMEDGRGVYWMPPNPISDPQQMSMTYDWIKRPDMWDKREKVTISGIVPDGQELLHRNFEANAQLGNFHNWRKLWGREQGKIALVVCPGPSLTESLPEIRKLARNRNRFFTIGLNRAQTSMDLNYYHIADRRGDRDWTQAGRRYKDTVLIAATTVACQHPPRFKERFWGEHFFGGVPDAQIERLTCEMCITLCDTMFTAYKLGASQLWVYGCDFAMQGKFMSDTRGERVALLEKYYHDMSAQEGMAIREHIFPFKPPVLGIGGRIVFVTWELIVYAAYASVMAHMIEHSGGVPVLNKTPCGIWFENWHTGGQHGDELSDAVPVCATQAGREHR